MDDFNYSNSNGFYGFTPPQKPKKPKKYGSATVIIASILAAVIGASSACGVFLLFNMFNDDTTSLQQPIIEGDKVSINVDKQASSVVEAVAQKVTPSVVGIRTTTSVMSFFGNQESSGEGSGVVYKENGYIITNYHVIADATSGNGSKIEVFLDNEVNAKSYQASVVGYNISSD